jgi:phosphoglycolate phosphatase
MAYKHILFDLDGTIIDSKIGITQSVAFALEKMGCEKQDLDLLTKYIGPPFSESLVNYNHFNPEQVKEAIGYYRERFKEKGVFENTLYPGIKEVFELLIEKGLHIYVATSKPTVFAEQILRNYRLDQYFTCIVGSNLDGTRVHKADVIEEVLLQGNILDRGTALMIGDREHDILGAKKTGLTSLGVEYGFGSFEELEDAGADYVVETVEQLKELLVRHLI